MNFLVLYSALQKEGCQIRSLNCPDAEAAQFKVQGSGYIRYLGGEDISVGLLNHLNPLKMGILHFKCIPILSTWSFSGDPNTQLLNS